MKRLTYLILLSVLCLNLYAQTKSANMKQVIEILQKWYQVNFVYDASLGNIKLANTPLINNSLEENLKTVLNKTGICWEKKDNYILLFRQKQHTYSGYVCQDNGETLINATIFDQTTKTGTLSNEHGFFSLTLSEGKHSIRISSIGYQETMNEIDLKADCQTTVYLKENTIPLADIEVIGNLNSPLNTTQTGKVSFTSEQLHTEYSLLSSPDLVKTIQNVPGVSSGTELLSGLYVHGGKNDENLFLLDGTPIYQINHVGGLFSAFNTDIIKNVDFYKSGFPARYGGRLSSVIDVRTKDGDMKEFHGNFSLGLIDGRIQFEGPIIKNRTSFNIAMRRSWADLLTAPAFAIFNRVQSNNDHLNARYAFHDINGKITHRFSDKSKLSLNAYSSYDLFKLHSQQYDTYRGYSQPSIDDYNVQYNVKWGNFTTSLAWNYQFNPKLSGNFTAIYAHNLSKFNYAENERTINNDICTSLYQMERYNHSTINDAGYRMEFDYRPNVNHHIRFGSNYLHHSFRPQNIFTNDINGNQQAVDTLLNATTNRYKGNEFTLYAEDDIRISPKLHANAGLHYTLFHVNGATYHSLEPRLALSYRISDQATLKASYTEMSQFMHQLSSTYLNLPTDCWVPSTSKIRPMRSRQIAGGVYMELPFHIQLNIEGYYRTSKRILEYDAGSTLTLPVDNWEDLVKTGKGRSYGLEISLTYRNSKNIFEAGYTLSWTQQKFKDFYPTWYAGKYDNRHKLSLTYRHKFNKHIDIYAAWTYRSGDRATIPTQYVEEPSLPGISGSDMPQPVFEIPNNITLPAYHRLDVGINFRKTTKRGFERIWNISIYNVYCRMNAFYTRIERQPNGSFRGKSFGIFPILPSFSYTLKF